jgi:hypothetical protein
MYKNATKCNETIGKWCKNKHGASKIIDTFETYQAYINLYYYLERTFDGCEVSHVSRASNEEADNLANIGSQCLPIPQGVFWEDIIERSIKSNKTSTTE